jgi:glucan 1,3-beta-glucosidase
MLIFYACVHSWGPTICGEFSQADTDCAQYLNDVGQGARWTGTFNTGNSSTDVLTPQCATSGNSKSPTCSCTLADADPSAFSSDYKKLLQTYAEAQFSAFESAWGWFYWTWQTESAPQWSYKQALANGFMPQKAYQPAFKCGDTIPNFGSLPEYY